MENVEKVRTDLYDDRLDISNNSIYEIGFNDIVILIKSKKTASFNLEHNLLLGGFETSPDTFVWENVI